MKPTVAENMKEEIVVEKCILALQNKNNLEERKSIKVTFRDDSKKKAIKHPYDMEGLQRVLKTMSNKMVEIKKQVVETSMKKPFRKFKGNQSTDPKLPNAISNVESDLNDDGDEDTVLSAKEIEEDETVGCHGMWDFILPNYDNESEHESLPINTKSKSIADPNQANSKKKNPGPITKDKAPIKKTPVSPPHNQPSASNHPSSSKTLAVLDPMDYNIVEEMKKT